MPALIARDHDPQVDHRGLAYRCVLTDYHVHLRPDDPDASPAQHFTTENVERYLEAANRGGIEELGVSEHVYRFTAALEIWDHPFWREQRPRRPRRLLRVRALDPAPARHRDGLLVDREDRIAACSTLTTSTTSSARSTSLAIARSIRTATTSGRRSAIRTASGGCYFEALEAAIRTGLFDILAHPDLVKVWGDRRPAPSRDPRFYYEPAVEAIAETGIAVEVSTAGLRKPVGELYPARMRSRACASRPGRRSRSPPTPTCPRTSAATTIRRWSGCATGESIEIAVFERRERRMEPLG